MPWAALAIMAAGVAALGGALVLEHFFAVLPCILCYYERVPYGLAILWGVLALACRKNDKAVQIFFWLAALGFLANAGLSFFHSGVELQWWPGTDECAVNPAVFTDPAAAREALLATPVVRCDEISFTFLGFSLANWNVPLGLGLALFSALAALRPRWKCLQQDASCGCTCCKKS